MNRLWTVTEPTKTTTYTYDGAGNRDKEVVVKDGTTTINQYTYDGSNRLLNIKEEIAGVLAQDTDYTYDNNGNQLTSTVTNYQGTITKSTTSYRYDVLNQMTGTTTAAGLEITYGYNGEGYRIVKSSNGKTVRYLYEGDKVILEVDGTGVEKARSVTGINQISRTIGGEVLYYLYNGHADVTLLANTLGETVATYYYDAFGEIIDSSGSADNPIRYAGYQYDEETGLYYLNARMYDPTIARFLQEDTYTGDKNDPLTLNLYVYCKNEPLMYTDPTGHFFKEIWNSAKTVVSDAWNGVKGAASDAWGSYKQYGSVGHAVNTFVKGSVVPIYTAKETFKSIGSIVNIGASKVWDMAKKEAPSEMGSLAGTYSFAKSTVTGILGLPGMIVSAVKGVVEDPLGSWKKSMVVSSLFTPINLFPEEKKALEKNIYDGIKKSVNDNLINGDEYTRTKFATEATLNIGSFFIGVGEIKALSGVGKTGKVLNAMDKTTDTLNAMDKTADALNAVDKTADLTNAFTKGGSKADIIQFEKYRASLAADEIINAERTSTALSKGDSSHLAASFLTKEQLAAGKVNGLRGGDGIQRTLLQTKGGLDGKYGVFEYILTKDGKVSHQRFIDGGVFTGTPNQVVPKGGWEAWKTNPIKYPLD